MCLDVVHRSRTHAQPLAQLSRQPWIDPGAFAPKCGTGLESKDVAVPDETPRSVLFRNRAKAFQNLASDLQTARPGYRELAAAYEQLANETERCEAIQAAAQQTPKPD